MSTYNHTDIGVGAGANASTINTPLGTLDAAIGNLASLTTTAKTSTVAALNELAANVLVGASVAALTLKAWTEAEAYEITAVTYDSDGVPATATVKWPDGSAGVWTLTPTTGKNATWLAVDGYSITHITSGKTVTQGTVTRDANSGQVTAKPALTVAP